MPVAAVRVPLRVSSQGICGDFARGPSVQRREGQERDEARRRYRANNEVQRGFNDLVAVAHEQQKCNGARMNLRSQSTVTPAAALRSPKAASRRSAPVDPLLDL